MNELTHLSLFSGIGGLDLATEWAGFRTVMNEMFEFIVDMPSGLDGFESDFDAAFGELNEVASTLEAQQKRIAELEAERRWVPVTERLPDNFVSVLGFMTDAGNFPAVRECYTVGNAFYFPALCDVHPVSHWMPLPEPPKEGE